MKVKNKKDWIAEDILKTENEGIEQNTNIQNILHGLYHWCCNLLLVYWFTPGGPAPPGFCLSFLEATATQAGRTPRPAWPAQGHVGHIHRLWRWHHKLVLQVAPVAQKSWAKWCFFDGKIFFFMIHDAQLLVPKKNPACWCFFPRCITSSSQARLTI